MSEIVENCLLVIDPQIDFCSPDGSLFINGAVEDMIRLNNWIFNNGKNIHKIFITLDLHHKNSIFHPNWWMDNLGNLPEPFTTISIDDVINGKWKLNNNLFKLDNFTKYYYNKTVNYLKFLKEKNLVHIIWPEHCLIGSKGANIQPELWNTLMWWSNQNYGDYEIIIKGLDKTTENYGAYETNYNPFYKYNSELLNIINYNNIYVAGQAKSHCVIQTIEQIFEQNENDNSFNMILLDNCSSNIIGFEEGTKKRYEALKKYENKGKYIDYINV